LKTVFMNLTEKHINLEEGTITPEVLQILREQLVESDFRRIADYILKIELSDRVDSSNVKGYENGVYKITGLPIIETALHDGKPIPWLFRKYIRESVENNVELSEALDNLNSTEENLIEE